MVLSITKPSKNSFKRNITDESIDHTDQLCVILLIMDISLVASSLPWSRCEADKYFYRNTFVCVFIYTIVFLVCTLPSLYIYECTWDDVSLGRSRIWNKTNALVAFSKVSVFIT